MAEFQERQKKNKKLLRELRVTRFIVKYNNYMLKLTYKNDRTPLENFILEHAIPTKKLESFFKTK